MDARISWFRALARLPLAVMAILAGFGRVEAQLSPGKLHAVHADLEGVANCARCHSADQGVADTKCLECHAALRIRIRAGRGLHASRSYDTCENCHVEHQGRDFELVYWKDGEERFDHGLTGNVLKGRHATLKCRDCHRAEFVRDPSVREAPRMDLNRTFLGLERDCEACHRDPHQGDLGARCTNCHGEEHWKPAPGFDHARTRYPLDGMHREVTCAKCHGPEAEGVSARFHGLTFTACSDCHTDPHRRRFQESCTGCHSTAGWKQVNPSRFDHDRTRYPLRGRHALVACVSCHQPGRPVAGLRFSACTDCHGSYRHRARYLATADRGACETCHVVEGFSPATFAVSRHASSRYPLDGAHLAVACPACHRAPDGAKPVATASARCGDCHADPHGADVRADAAPRGCESCHATASWRTVAYDHAITRFPLEGRHQVVNCGRCHAIRPGAVTTVHQFRDTSSWCADCHEDIHRGQFEEAIAIGGKTRTTTRCSRCHSSTDWLAERFDHDRDSRYRLEGAHARVRCTGCHLPAESAGRPFVRYRPLDMTCEACHDTQTVEGRDTP